ncbi:MAG: hypothetical protein Q7R39_09235 [Dehalococcoidia bacterium]|nr:hypothetical protein [Dehalococcoidia bacterium]
MGIYRDVFELAAKVGSMEGYLWERPDASSRYLPNWLGNLERMYASLPLEAQADCSPAYREVLSKAVEGMDKLLGPGDEIVLLAKRLLADLG